MWEESIPSILASVYGWFTPAVLFLLLNLVIGTIAVTSKVGAGGGAPPVQPSGDGDDLHQSGSASVADARFLRSPSAIFDRFRSFNLHRHRVPEAPVHTEVVAAEQPLHRAEIVNSSLVPASGDGSGEAAAVLEEVEEVMEGEEEDHLKPLGRSQSDAQPTAGEIPPKLAVRIKKSASDMSAFAHFEEAEIVETLPPTQPAYAWEAAAGAEASVSSGDEVDARADDFINRFRQQLKLQRSDSIMRYKEMINRAAK